MAGDTRPNYFVLLELDPDEPWNHAHYQRRLRDKRNEWGRRRSGVQTSRKAVEARRALDLLPHLEEVMGDESKRDDERSDARQLRAGEKNARLAELAKVIDIMLEKGFLYDVEEADLRRRYGDLLDDAEVADQLAGASRRVLEAEREVPERLEASQASAIRTRLDELGEESLYTLLARIEPTIGPESGLDALCRAAEELYRRAYRTADKRQAGLAAKQELAGRAKTIFSSAAERERYDNTLKQEPLDRLLRRYRSALEPVRSVDSRQAERFLREARDAGVEESLARKLLLQHFTSLQWTVALPPDDGARAVRCRRCRTFNDPGDQFCRDCGAPFRDTCPSCDATVSAHDVCARCGFPVADRDWVRSLLEDCEELLGQGDLPGAETKLRLAQEAWPLPAGSTDQIAARITGNAQRVTTLREQRQTADGQKLRTILTQMENRHYRAAWGSLATTHSQFSDRERLLNEARSHIDAAERLTRRARESGTAAEQAELYAKALDECADHEEARKALRDMPPHPPRELRAVATEELVRLEWQPSPTTGVRYVIVRKSGAPPVSIMDGRRIDVVRTLAYDDVCPEVGVPVHYAVFADRDGTASQHGATTQDPVFLAREVTITAPRVDDGTVELEWTLPPNAEGVTAHRTSEACDGSEVVPTEPTRLLARGLRNGVSHTFTFRARFRDADGEIRLSPGRTVSLTPGPPPEPVGTVHVTALPNLGFSHSYLRLGWHAPDQGRVVVLKTQERPSIGDRLLAAELPRHGQILDEEAAHGHSLLHEGFYYFTPVLIHHEIAYVGGVRRYAAVGEAEDLSAEAHGDAVRLRWTWPSSCETVQVAYAHTSPPDDPTVAAHRTTVERDDYDRLGHHEIRGLKGGGEYFFVVAALVRRDDEVFVSAGSRGQVHLRPKGWKRGARSGVSRSEAPPSSRRRRLRP